LETVLFHLKDGLRNDECGKREKGETKERRDIPP
jgi:hypothetical protein